MYKKIIKYCALAFAIFLIVSIFTGINKGIQMIFGEDDSILEEMVVTNLKDKDFDNIELDIEAVNIEIITGEYFEVSTNNKYIKINTDNNKLSIIEENEKIIKINTNIKSKLIVTLPEKEFNDVKLKTGAGVIKIDNMITSSINLDLGAGTTNIKYLKSTKKANIECGAGSFDIQNGVFDNLDLELGVGKFTANMEISNLTNIKSGIGTANINVYGSMEDYKFDTKIGIGTLKINNNNISKDEIIGDGSILIKVEGGIGTISINVLEEEDSNGRK